MTLIRSSVSSNGTYMPSYFEYPQIYMGDYSSKNKSSDTLGYISYLKSYTLNEEKIDTIGEKFLEKIMKNITDVEYDNLKLKFKTPFSFPYVFEDDAYFYQIPELSLFGYGNDLTDMLNDFYENIVIDWKIYVKNDESKLNKNALALRKRLLELLEEY